MTLHLRYFARLADEAGVCEETVETSAATLGDLWTETTGRHGFSLPQEAVRAAVGTDYAPWDQALTPGSTVAFLPPVGGG